MEIWQNMIGHFQMAYQKRRKVNSICWSQNFVLYRAFSHSFMGGTSRNSFRKGEKIRVLNIGNSHSIHFISMKTNIYAKYGDLHAKELLRDNILSIKKNQ